MDPRWGLRPQTPIIGSRSRARHGCVFNPHFSLPSAAPAPSPSVCLGRSFCLVSITVDRQTASGYLTRWMVIVSQMTLQSFVDKLFQSIFTADIDTVPPAVKYLFDLFDVAALQHGLNDPDVVHSWKSNRSPLCTTVAIFCFFCVFSGDCQSLSQSFKNFQRRTFWDLPVQEIFLQAGCPSGLSSKNVKRQSILTLLVQS